MGQHPIRLGYDRENQLVKIGEARMRLNPINGVFLGDTVKNTVLNVNNDLYGELANMNVRNGTNTIFIANYQRDSLGRITRLSESIQGLTNSYAYHYDDANRLTEVKKNDTIIAIYSYDNNGNRIQVSRSLSIDSAYYDVQDKLLSYNNIRYEYTNNGHLHYRIQGVDTTIYIYNKLGNLCSVRLNDGTFIEYDIDPQNRRIGRKVNGNYTNKWVYSGTSLPIAELDSAGCVTTRYVGNYFTRNGNTYRLIKDHLGSVRLVVNAQTGEIVQQIDYNDFGRVLYDSNPGYQPFGFANGIYDYQSGLVRFGVRDYDPETGRWLSKDPIGFAGGSTNLYSYCNQDPVNNTDLSGTFIINPTVKPVTNNADLMALEVAQTRVARDIAIGLTLFAVFSEEITATLDCVDRLWQEAMEQIDAKRDPRNRTYITYSLTKNDMTYYGRASGYGTPDQVLRKRLATHWYVLIEGYQPKGIDQRAYEQIRVQGYEAYDAIRGREQQLMDARVLAKGRDKLANRIRGVSLMNENRETYFEASNAWFGNIAPLNVVW